MIEKEIKRNKNGQFEKGGGPPNPNGRPIGSKGMTTQIKEFLEREYTPSKVGENYKDILIKSIVLRAIKKSDLMAKLIIEQIDGKPKTSGEMDVKQKLEDGDIRQIINTLPKEKQKKFYETIIEIITETEKPENIKKPKKRVNRKTKRSNTRNTRQK